MRPTDELFQVVRTNDETSTMGLKTYKGEYTVSYCIAITQSCFVLKLCNKIFGLCFG
jgi:hypothetical protein